jgi:tartrate-resistant acid phosphatase type 5
VIVEGAGSRDPAPSAFVGVERLGLLAHTPRALSDLSPKQHPSKPRAARLAALLGSLLITAGAVIWVTQPTERPRVIAHAATPSSAAVGPVLRFVAVGDTGKGNDTQVAVAHSMAATCLAHGGCAFGLLLGDNIYPAGVDSANDPAWAEKFDGPYAAEPFPFYASLGNHDYGFGWEFWKAHAQLDYANANPKFILPARHYSFSAGPVDFFALDTNALFWGAADEERDALRSQREQSHQPWKIAFGHHPYLSNGHHGNAGHYDHMPSAAFPAAGGTLDEFFKTEIVDHVDLYLCGHDHNMQDLGQVGSTAFFVSGAGSSTTALGDHNKSLFQASVPGFLLVEVTTSKMLLTFVDERTHELYHRALTK